MNPDLRVLAEKCLLARGQHVSAVAIQQLAPHYLGRQVTEKEANDTARLCRKARVTVHLPTEETT